MKNIPVRQIDTVYHFGSLNPADRGKHFETSYEGAGLSVSVTPYAWETIAKLGGSTLHAMTYPGALFLDFHRLNKKQKKDINNWAVANGLAQATKMWQAHWYDDEDEETKFCLCATKELALEEMESNGNEDGQPIQVEVICLTELGSKRACGFSQKDAADDMTAMFWAEDVARQSNPNIVGLWWHDRLDVYAYSAPRGGIFPACVKLFTPGPPVDLLEDEEEMLEKIEKIRHVELHQHKPHLIRG
jgi:hypothetical protein